MRLMRRQPREQRVGQHPLVILPKLYLALSRMLRKPRLMMSKTVTVFLSVRWYSCNDMQPVDHDGCILP